MQGINPGGYYYAIWCRDASYILKDWFLSDHTSEVLRHLYLIWSHQISGNVKGAHDDDDDKTEHEKEKVIFGRGSPEEKFRTATLPDTLRNSFEGALPTTIYQAGYSEVYGKNPDIDSTALMISTTSWILSHVLDEHHERNTGQVRQNEANSSQSYNVRVASHRSSSISKMENRDLVQDPVALAIFSLR